jgi:small subunit ribosomal protein S24e
MFEIQEPATPSRSSVRREIAVLMKVDLEQVYVKNLETKTGTHRTLGLVHVYDDIAVAIEVEPQHTIQRNKLPQSEPEQEEK